MVTPMLFEFKIFSKIIFLRHKFLKDRTWKAIHFHIETQCFILSWKKFDA